MPSRASSDSNSRCDSACIASARSAKRPSAAAVVSGFVSASPCGEHARNASQTGEFGVDVVDRGGDQPGGGRRAASNVSPVR